MTTMHGKAIQGSVALVTGANRGIGRAIVEALLARGATKVYAGARRPSDLGTLANDARVVPLTLDVTNDGQVAEAAAQAPDVTLLVNNAGVVARPLGAPLTDAVEGARQEMDVNYLGTLRMTAAFAPALARSGGGTIVNIASIAGVTGFSPFATYSASKAAQRSLTQVSRVMLGGQGTQVIGVYPGPVDTDMAKALPWDKATPASVATRILDAVEAGQLEVYPDPMAEGMGAAFEASPSALERQVAAMADQPA
ncbi:MAG: SDR family oxidoreductase [Gemmatimonadales bacterium]|nr:SDR family oxidoreductase [Gemmatimonadales bacterium]